MDPIGVMHTVDQGYLMHDPRHVGQVFTDLRARNGSGNWIEFATCLDRGVGLHVEGIDMAGAAVLEDQNAGADIGGNRLDGGLRCTGT